MLSLEFTITHCSTRTLPSMASTSISMELRGVVDNICLFNSKELGGSFSQNESLLLLLSLASSSVASAPRAEVSEMKREEETMFVASEKAKAEAALKATAERRSLPCRAIPLVSRGALYSRWQQRRSSR